jgi:hypothetical protein
MLAEPEEDDDDKSSGGMMSDVFDASGSRCRASPTISRHPPMVPEMNFSILDIADKCLKQKKDTEADDKLP